MHLSTLDAAQMAPWNSESTLNIPNNDMYVKLNRIWIVTAVWCIWGQTRSFREQEETTDCMLHDTNTKTREHEVHLIDILHVMAVG